MIKNFNFATKLINKTKEDDILALSAQLSYYLILSIFPFLILAISLMCGYSEYIYSILNSLSDVIRKKCTNYLQCVKILCCKLQQPLLNHQHADNNMVATSEVQLS